MRGGKFSGVRGNIAILDFTSSLGNFNLNPGNRFELELDGIYTLTLTLIERYHTDRYEAKPLYGGVEFHNNA